MPNLTNLNNRPTPTLPSHSTSDTKAADRAATRPNEKTYKQDHECATLHGVLAGSANLKALTDKINNPKDVPKKINNLKDVPEAEKKLAIDALQAAKQKYDASTSDKKGGEAEDHIVVQLLQDHSVIRKAIRQLVSEQDSQAQKRLSYGQMITLGLGASSAVHGRNSELPPKLGDQPPGVANTSLLQKSSTPHASSSVQADATPSFLSTVVNAGAAVGAAIDRLTTFPGAAAAPMRDDASAVNFNDPASPLYFNGGLFPKLLAHHNTLLDVKTSVPLSQYEELRNRDPIFHLPDQVLAAIEYGSSQWAKFSGLLTSLSIDRHNPTELLKKIVESGDATTPTEFLSILDKLNDHLELEFAAKDMEINEPFSIEKSRQLNVTSAEFLDSLNKISGNALTPDFFNSGFADIEHNLPPSLISTSLQAEAVATRMGETRSVRDIIKHLDTLPPGEVEAFNQRAKELLHKKPISENDFSKFVLHSYGLDVSHADKYRRVFSGGGSDEEKQQIDELFSSKGFSAAPDVKKRYDNYVAGPRKSALATTLAHSINTLDPDIKNKWNAIDDYELFHIKSVLRKSADSAELFDFTGNEEGGNTVKIKEPLGYVIAKGDSDPGQRDIFLFHRGQSGGLQLEYIGQHHESDAIRMANRQAFSHAREMTGSDLAALQSDQRASAGLGVGHLESNLVDAAEKKEAEYSRRTKRDLNFSQISGMIVDGLDLGASLIGLGCPVSLARMAWNVADDSFAKQDGLIKGLGIANTAIACTVGLIPLGGIVSFGTKAGIAAVRVGIKSAKAVENIRKVGAIMNPVAGLASGWTVSNLKLVKSALRREPLNVVRGLIGMAPPAGTATRAMVMSSTSLARPAVIEAGEKFGEMVLKYKGADFRFFFKGGRAATLAVKAALMKNKHVETHLATTSNTTDMEAQTMHRARRNAAPQTTSNTTMVGQTPSLEESTQSILQMMASSETGRRQLALLQGQVRGNIIVESSPDNSFSRDLSEEGNLAIRVPQDGGIPPWESRTVEGVYDALKNQVMAFLPESENQKEQIADQILVEALKSTPEEAPKETSEEATTEMPAKKEPKTPSAAETVLTNTFVRPLRNGS